MRKRIAHALASAGVASRRAAERIIAEGRVTVNGKLVTVPMVQVDLREDRVEVDRRRIGSEEKKVYFLLNKPTGLICTSEPGPAKRVIQLFSHLSYRLFTVGRLDQATAGLLIVTNDGDLAHRLTHPSFQVQKEYLAKVNEEVSADALATIAQGMWMDGSHVKPLRVVKMRRGTLKIVVGEGKKHEVRRLLTHGGLTVRELTRIRIGPLHLGHLPEGAYRTLTQPEISALYGKESDDVLL